jgi:hypothetical protein
MYPTSRFFRRHKTTGPIFLLGMSAGIILSLIMHQIIVGGPF